MYTRHADQEGKQRAGQLADAVLQVDPGNRDAHYVKSAQLLSAGRHREALSMARQLDAEGYPADSVLYGAQVELGDYAAALDILEKTEVQDDSAIFRGKARCLIGLRRYDEALQAARVAAELNPSAPDVQLRLGLAAMGVGDLALAQRSFRAALTGSGDDRTAAAAANPGTVAALRMVAALLMGPGVLNAGKRPRQRR